jgi:hypothetical protein
LGLFVSGGRLLKFDSAGNFKAKEALSVTDIEPGMPVKAKVTGVIVEEADTVMVASIEIKGPDQIRQIRSSQGFLASRFFR